MCNIFSGHIIADKGKDWGKILFITGIHHEEDRKIIGKKYEKLIAWETTKTFDLSDVVITHDCGQNLNSETKKIFKNLIMEWLKEKTINDLICMSTELKNLKSLDLENNQLTDVSGLAELKNLKSLYLRNNQLTDVSGLAELKNLESLDLENNQLTDVSGLAELKNLESLDLNY